MGLKFGVILPVLILKKIQHLQNRMAQIISGNFDYTGPIMTLVKDLGWQDISARKRYLTSILYKNVLIG